MTKREEYESRTEKLMLPIVEEMNFELVDVEYVKEGGNYFLRAYIDKEGGITINDCETVSRRLSDLLDEADFIPDSYILEVSSPGLGRPLKKDKDFARSIGKKVEIRLFQAVNRNKEFTGVLSAYDKDSVTITQEDSEVIIIPRSGIALIRLALDI
ncbi:MAG TPA: ribosome maturation factor RimP [Candidatus Caccomorpha excrementavium]|nr:ribosome maturation factor RimP [Candidatus Caccomorpha excrementavium]